LRVALLSGATTDLIEEPLQLAIESVGLGCEILASGFNTLAQEMLDPESETVRFAPDVAVLVTTPHNIPAWPAPGDDDERVREIVDEVVSYWLGLCTALHDAAGCDIVMSNFHLLPTRPVGNLGSRVAWAPNRFLQAVNARLASRLPSYVHVNDVSELAAMHGVLNWFDARFWYHAKQPVSFQCAVPYVRNIAHIIAAIYGKTAKCLVLDLDNTLWGGVVGDDGPDNLVLGEGDGTGEAFKAFQAYVRQLRSRGLLLAVCSKNEPENARAPFERHPEMVLGLDDFVAFKANWNPKSENLIEIARELNIGLDALMFIDDNPAEREQVRQSLPEVKVVELSEDPARFPLDLDRTGWLDTVSLSVEDGNRTELYRANAEREQLQKTATDYRGYLVSLEQEAVVGPFEPVHMERITQLTNKTNQFNLTTRRMSRSELEGMMGDPDHVTAFVRLADRFGDNGLISVFAGHRWDNELWIDLWLMSCRVFGRSVEHLLCNEVVERARAMGLESLRGIFIPSGRNELVREHYRGLGFTEITDPPAGDGEGASHWRLDLEAYQPFDVAITVVSPAAAAGAAAGTERSS
jgi:FkbH-like protein